MQMEGQRKISAGIGRPNKPKPAVLFAKLESLSDRTAGFAPLQLEWIVAHTGPNL
jgi:hypothetical protein